MYTQAISDSDLVSKYIHGDEKSLEILILKHKQKIYGFIYSKILDKDLTEDIFQDTFIKVIKTLKQGKYNEEGKFLPWVMRIAHNLVIDHFRKSSRMPKFSRTDDFDIFDVLSDASMNRESEIIQKQLYKQITPLLFAKADNPFDMVKLSIEQIKEIIRPCGLSPMKSKGIYGLSKILIEKYNGDVPQNFEGLEELPAVGHKTASVVMSQAFGIPAFPVDTHIHRLMYRWNLTNGKNVAQTEKDAKRLFPKENWNDLHLQMIWYGREYSPARGWNLEKDIITKTIGRKTVLDEYYNK